MLNQIAKTSAILFDAQVDKLKQSLESVAGVNELTLDNLRDVVAQQLGHKDYGSYLHSTASSFDFSCLHELSSLSKDEDDAVKDLQIIVWYRKWMRDTGEISYSIAPLASKIDLHDNYKPVVKIMENRYQVLMNVSDYLELVFVQMQAENWSRNGSARGIIQENGLSHTSMSVGDLIQIEDMFYFVGMHGFKPIKKEDIVNI